MNMTEKLVQGSPEWHAMRKNFIGASDAPVIMEESPWQTPYQLWEEKQGLRRQRDTTQAMQKGIDLEPVARELFVKKTNIQVKPDVMFSNKHKWMMASLDGIDQEKKTLVEIKVAGEQDHALAEKGKIPLKYYYQLQHQMEVTGLDHMFYFSFRDGEGVIVEVGRHEKDIELMVVAEKIFYKNMTDFLAPPLSTKDYEQQTSDDWRLCSEEWLRVQQEKSCIEEREDDLRKKLILLSEGKNSSGCGVKTIKTVRKGNISYTNIPELKTVDLEQYRKEPVEFWKIIRS